MLRKRQLTINERVRYQALALRHPRPLQKRGIKLFQESSHRGASHTWSE